MQAILRLRQCVDRDDGGYDEPAYCAHNEQRRYDGQDGEAGRYTSYDAASALVCMVMNIFD